MPKYVMLDWTEYTKLRDDLKVADRKARNGDWFRNQLIPLIETPENAQYYNILGPLPPIDWKPVTDEQIIERIQEKFNGK